MNDTSFLYRPGALTDIGIGDPAGRVAATQGPVMATPGVLAGVVIGYALLNAFAAGLDGGPIYPEVP